MGKRGKSENRSSCLWGDGKVRDKAHGECREDVEKEDNGNKEARMVNA